MSNKVSEQGSFVFWLTLSLAVSFVMQVLAYNPWEWGLFQSENTGNTTRNILIILWLFVFVVWAIIVAIPLVKHFLEQDHFFAITVTVLVIVGGAVVWAMWNGFFTADDSAVIHLLVQFLIALVLATSSAMARQS